MADNSQESGAVFNVEKLYIKDASYESPNAPHVFAEKQAQPNLHLQLDVEHKALNEAEGMYEVVLAVTATAKFQETAIFLAEAHQAGLFRILGVPPKDLSKVLEITCPGILLGQDLGALRGIARRACKRVTSGAVHELTPPEQHDLGARLEGARAEVEQLFQLLAKEMEHVGRRSQENDSRAS
jgi:preprotein translocase subunit SecB